MGMTMPGISYKLRSCSFSIARAASAVPSGIVRIVVLIASDVKQQTGSICMDRSQGA